MNRIRGMLAALVLLPLLALGANLATASGAQAPVKPGMSQLTGSDPYTCCWVFFNGYWRCIPC